MTETRTAPRADRRVERSRAALRNAFHQLVLDRGYEAISVADVTQLANVGRSTFYQHYAGLDDLLTQSLADFFAVLARASLEAQPDPAMTWVLQHFWENRKVAGAMFGFGGAGRVLQPLLSDCFEASLSARWPGASKDMTARRKVLAPQLAAGALHVMGAWVSGRLPGSAEDIAEALRRTGHAAAVASFAAA